MRALFTFLTIITAFTAVAFAAQAQAPIYTERDGVGAGGYDVVSYFTGGAPVRGSVEFTAQWQGASWYFSSAAHLAEFEKTPERYAPQYGGYCAWAITKGNLAPADPLVYQVVNGKLYLNFNRDIAQRWQANRAAFIEDADSVYPSLVTFK